eukprot:TRINITY_DN71_c1_g1_i1.p1 TRINITY_DN71_c1_g1~~TRINITY_DN71_c1_g1_i1.p1  ORF type:complete len:287 (+),score=108.99 TRINITY_DN71_c1_g1_i1:56-916(+)
MAANIQFLEPSLDLNNSIDYVGRYEVPKDEEDLRFLKSFTIHQVDQYKQFFEEFGFVIIKNVFNETEINNTINDIWDYISNNSRFERNKPETWSGIYPGLVREGIVCHQSLFSANCLINRQNELIYQVFANLMGRNDLLVNHDRFAFFRPTQNLIVDPSKPPQSFPQWKTKTNLHLDMNPWRYFEANDQSEDEYVLSKLNYKHDGHFIIENNFIGVNNDIRVLPLQGLVNLVDNVEEDGGFIIVPGFRKHLKQWTQTNQILKDKYGLSCTFVIIPSSDSIYDLAIR